MSGGAGVGTAGAKRQGKCGWWCSGRDAGRGERAFVISSGGVAGVEKSASTRRGTVRHDNVPSGVLEHGAGYEKARKRNLSRAGGQRTCWGCWLGTIRDVIVRKCGPRGAGPSRSTRRKAPYTRQSGRRRGAKRAGASTFAARRHRRACLCPCLKY